MRPSTLLLPIALCQMACVLPTGGRAVGPSLSRKLVEKFASGVHTKADLFARLGPPMAVAGRGETVRVASPARPTLGRPPADFPLQGDALLELFRDGTPLTDEHRVYYWARERERGWMVLLFVVNFRSLRSTVDELFVLVNERTGRVEGAVGGRYPREDVEPGPRPG